MVNKVSGTIYFTYEDDTAVVLLSRGEAAKHYNSYRTKVPVATLNRYKAAQAEYEAAQHKLREAINAKLGKPFRSCGLFLGVSSG